jgi:hypothetical protein
MRKKNQGPKISRYSSRHTTTNMPPHIPMYCIQYMGRMYCNILNTVEVENFQRQDVLYPLQTSESDMEFCSCSAQMAVPAGW